FKLELEKPFKNKNSFSISSYCIIIALVSVWNIIIGLFNLFGVLYPINNLCSKQSESHSLINSTWK
ncbi:MAG: hypothetical protein KDC52_16800, partial [Ignavibacteriae bacterium]|nr:hypothetical protein [Ignavibacteriota bacterium]